MSTFKPHSRGIALASIDGRSREAVMMRRIRADLVAHLGGSPSATQRVLIDRAAMLSLRLALLDERALAGDGVMADAKTYLAWSNSLDRAMRTLGLKGVAERPRTITDRLAANRAAAA